MKIKVCGMTSVDQIKELIELGVDYAGIIFYEHSPRYAGSKLEKERLKEIAGLIKLTGVFVNEDIREIKKKISDYHLDAVQLCGDEAASSCADLRNHAEVTKVIGVGDEGVDQDLAGKYAGSCDYLLFDTKSKAYGGSGIKFNWESLEKAGISHPFFLSGGISDDDAEMVRSFDHIFFSGIDINSRFEISPGIKDIKKIQIFISQVKTQ